MTKLSEFTDRLHRAGVPMVAGTDSLAGIVLHSELIGYVKAGLTPVQALQVASRNGARCTGTEADRGAITPGRRADLILLDGEPTERIEDIRKVALVITQGHWIAPRQVHEALGILSFVDATRWCAARPPRTEAGAASARGVGLHGNLGLQRLRLQMRHPQSRSGRQLAFGSGAYSAACGWRRA